MTSPTTNASLIERVVESWEDIPDWANEDKAKAVIDIVLEEAAQRLVTVPGNFNHLGQPLPSTKADMAAIRAMKGRNDG